MHDVVQKDQEGKPKRFVVHLLHATVHKSVTPQYTAAESPCKGPLADSETYPPIEVLFSLLTKLTFPRLCKSISNCAKL